MISYIEGDIKELTPTYIILNCNGIGYLLNISLTTFSKVEPYADNKIQLFTHLHIREDAHTLYGFFEKEERKIFRLLLSQHKPSANSKLSVHSN